MIENPIVIILALATLLSALVYGFVSYRRARTARQRRETSSFAHGHVPKGEGTPPIDPTLQDR